MQSSPAMPRLRSAGAARAVALSVAASAAVGCSSKPPTIIDVCGQPPQSIADPQVAAVLSAARGRHYLEGTWLNGRQGVVMTVDVDTGSALAGSGTGCGEALVVGATVAVETRDGVVQGQATAIRFYSPSSALAEIPLPDLDPAYARPDPALAPLLSSWQPVRQTSDAVPTLMLAFAEGGTTGEMIVDQERLVGDWSSDSALVPLRQAAPYVVPADLATECAPAADYTAAVGQYTPFASADDALAAMPGNWIRCRAFGASSQAGLQISPDRTWRTLSWQGGELVTRGGLGEEGTVDTPIDVSAMNWPGYFQTNLTGPAAWLPTNVWGDRLIMGNVDAPPDLEVHVYVRTNRPAATVTNSYAVGQRAGAAACATPETGAVETGLGAALESVLAGQWTLCSGELLEGPAALRFDGQGHVTLLAADGSEIVTSSYQAFQPETVPVESPRETILDLGDQQWSILFSERPLKLRTAVTGTHTSSRVALFSPI
jgi:hypothetical protein